MPPLALTGEPATTLSLSDGAEVAVWDNGSNADEVAHYRQQEEPVMVA